MSLVDTKSWDGSLRHLALVWEMRPYGGGRHGHPLYSDAFLVFDQGSITWSYPGVGNAPTITNLPLCKRCEKKAAEL